jgi:hypothetical protein
MQQVLGTSVGLHYYLGTFHLVRLAIHLFLTYFTLCIALTHYSMASMFPHDVLL